MILRPMEDVQIYLLHDGDSNKAPVEFFCPSLKLKLWSNVDEVIKVFKDSRCAHLLPGLGEIPPTRIEFWEHRNLEFKSEPINSIVRLFHTLNDQIGIVDFEPHLRYRCRKTDSLYCFKVPFKGESLLLNLPDELIEHILKLTVRVYTVEVALLNCVCRAFRNKFIYYNVLTDVNHQSIDSLAIYHPVLVTGVDMTDIDLNWLRERWLPFLFKRLFLGENPRFATFTRLQSEVVFTRFLKETCKRMNLETDFELKLKYVAEPLFETCYYSDEARELVQLMKPAIVGDGDYSYLYDVYFEDRINKKPLYVEFNSCRLL